MRSVVVVDHACMLQNIVDACGPIYYTDLELIMDGSDATMMHGQQPTQMDDPNQLLPPEITTNGQGQYLPTGRRSTLQFSYCSSS